MFPAYLKQIKKPCDISLDDVVDEGADKVNIEAVVGNPPYQTELKNTSDKPIYNMFMDMAYEISDYVMLITPARFLFNAGKTPKAWNEKMLTDEHLKVCKFESNGNAIFPNADIKGGIVITLHDNKHSFGAIGTFIAFKELQSIFDKTGVKGNKETLSDIVSSFGEYQFSPTVLKDHPEVVDMQSKGHSLSIVPKAFNTFNNLLFFHQPLDNDDYVQLIGLNGRNREYRYIKKSYIDYPANFNHYKVFVPKANGSGSLGERLSTPLIGAPLIGHTDTFLSIGDFEYESEAESCLKYIKTKFARVMLGVLKVTQDNTRSKWRFVPLQDFSASSDIDWSKSVADIDSQLYSKYGLSDEEIEFIESHVKSMD